MTPPDSGHGLRWAVALGVALFAHLAALGLAMWQRAPVEPPPPALAAQAVMVELAPAPAAPAAPPSPLPPGPPQRERTPAAPRPPAARPAEPVQDDAPPQSPPPARSVQQDPAAERAPAAMAAVAAAAAADTAPPSVPSPRAERPVAPQALSGAAATQAAASWQAQLLGHLERSKRYPRPAQRRRQEGVAQVRFSVDRTGKVSGAAIATTSGYPVLDAETLATVRRASPLPPPPDAIAGDPVEVVVPVEFFIAR